MIHQQNTSLPHHLRSISWTTQRAIGVLFPLWYYDQVRVHMLRPWRERLGRRLQMFAADTAFMIRVEHNWNIGRELSSSRMMINSQPWGTTQPTRPTWGRNFLTMNTEKRTEATPTYAKGGMWMSYLGHSISLCARATRAILNHATIGQYRARFFRKHTHAHVVNQISKLDITSLPIVRDLRKTEYPFHLHA